MGDSHLTPNTLYKLEDVYLDSETFNKLSLFVKEYSHREMLESHMLPISTKLLFYGASGCGKTFTAQALANELNCKLIVINLAEIVSSRLGETAKNLASLFQKANIRKAVLFLDEFDSLGTVRNGDSKESGEMRRVVNTLLQLIDNLKIDVILIAATNQITLLDPALTRRFELKIEFRLPKKNLLNTYYNDILKNFPSSCQSFERKYNISYAEAKVLTLNKVKEILIANAESALKTISDE